jgi:hypothetical protein
MKFQTLNVFINKFIEWKRETRISVRVDTRDSRNRKGRKTNNGKRSAIEMTLAKHS